MWPCQDPAYGPWNAWAPALPCDLCTAAMQGGQASQAAVQAAQAEALAAKRASLEHIAEVAALRSELDKLNRQLEQTCTLRLQPHDASDSQVTATGSLAWK